MTRKSFSKKFRIEIFSNKGGRCYLCKGLIQVGDKWDIEHIIPIALGGSNEDDNLDIVHAKCHRFKTNDDVKVIAKAKRVEAKHKGFARPKGKIQSRGFDKVKKVPLIDKSELPY